ncbi:MULTISPECIES: pyridoxamine 5'-phosphate oxidase family protein [Streptomyces]|uniref:pyridoxamine 5'-phosphate oxidase family protein n=1 Tax=Streptomyces TaxID=1883 RepID=UPI002248DF4F|nr:pyridoxamine 5'-phosphate oxidase family protein [Streptomyces sp. JHD 1]MCX2967936.1 pyridoxamine 5'-phosphate oxidase family protein [Streptomyces sp. JHD 1]
MAVHDSGSRPGSAGEHEIQAELGSTERADRFYGDQMLDHLNERMREFTRRQEMFFLATSDRNGSCDSTFRAGPPGFVQVLDERTLAFPEYRGNGVHASLGNIRENPQLGILLVDFLQARIGLHVNGTAEILRDAELRAEYPHLPHDPVPGRRAELWVRVSVEEAYIHCAKHIPHLQHAPKGAAREGRAWGSDDSRRKGGDYFGAARDRAAREATARERAAGEGEPTRADAAGQAPSAPASAVSPVPEASGGARRPGPPPTGAAVPPPPAHPPVAAPLAGAVPPQPTRAPAAPAEPVAPSAPTTGSGDAPDTTAPDVALDATAPGPAPDAVSGTASGEAPLSAQAWRERAKRLLAEVEARRPPGGAVPYEEWFSGRRG